MSNSNIEYRTFSYTISLWTLIMVLLLVDAVVGNSTGTIRVASFKDMRNCPASSLINTEHDHIWPYPDFYFNTSIHNTTGIYNNEPSYDCFSFDRDDESLASFKYIDGFRPDVLVPIRHQCISNLCPVYDQNIYDLFSELKWKANIHAICELSKHKFKSITRTINIVVLGGSMTRALDIGGTCCKDFIHPCSQLNGYELEFERKDEYFCSWSGFFIRSLRHKYPEIEFNFHNLAQSGAGSPLMALEVAALLSEHNITLTKNDIVFVDHSCNDFDGVTIYDFELLIRQILHYSKSIPTIIIMEQYLYGLEAYTEVYRQVAEHYRLPIFSHYSVLISNFSRQTYPMRTDIYEAYERHVPWHVHLLIADYLAVFIDKLVGQCTNPELNLPLVNPVSMHKIPKSLNKIHHLEHHTCDISIPYVLNLHAKKQYHPENLTAFELTLTEWTEYTDYHNVPGWIVNQYATKKNITFELPEYSDELYLDRELLLRIKYLRTYKGAGRVNLYICEHKIIRLDALFTLAMHRKVSIPRVFTYTMDVNHTKEWCFNEPGHNFIRLEYDKEDDHFDNQGFRGTHKFKLLGISLCHPAIRERNKPRF